ncbi:MAG: hypothetical protein BGO49_04455 [Planctomycetales bacterium 71-10]|nr:MAG: hypothetical protein BGO49_04455 [Planctomycetales bacterium 71-10]
MQGRLTHAEECILCGRARAGDDHARNRLVMEHMGLARKLARAAGRRGPVDVADLVQEAVFGIVRAAAKYDPVAHPGVRFGNYAARWMHLYIARALDAARIIHVPEYIESVLRSGGDGAALTPGRRAARDAAARILAAEYLPVGVDDAAARPDPEPDEDLGEGLAALPMIQRHVVGRLYGLDGGPPASLKRTAEEIGCSVFAVRRIARTALDRLRAELSRRHERRRKSCAYPKKCNPNRRKG